MRPDLDDRIDDVVSEMLDVEPPTDLRARVLERVAHPHPHPHPHTHTHTHTHPLRWALVPIAAIALLMLVVAAPWRSPENGSPPIRSTSIAQEVRPISVPVRRGANLQPVEGVRALANARIAEPALRFAANEPATAVSVAPLERLDAIDVAPVAVRSLNHQQIAVEPLAPLAQIDVEPVGPPEGRN